MLGCRLIICGSDDEIKKVVTYLKETGRKYVIGETTDVSSINILCPKMTVIYYYGSIFDQYKLAEITNGLSIYEED